MEENKNNLPAITQATVTAQINIALTQQSISVQKVQDLADGLVYNEDNLQEIADVINLTKAIDKIATKKHEELKRPITDAGKEVDKAKNSILAITEEIRKPIVQKYNVLCAAIEMRKEEAALEKARIAAITSGIENNILNFSNQIAACDSNEKLLAVERAINLEKSESRKAKYQEFHEKAIEKFNTILLPILKNQKEKIKAKELLDKQIKEAENNNDVQKLDELAEKKEQITNEILQNQVDVQQNALNQPLSFAITPVEEVLPDVKTVTRISFEIVDVNAAIKKCPELLEVTIKFLEAQKIAMTLKEAGTFKDKDEVVVNGIRFYNDKNYKA